MEMEFGVSISYFLWSLLLGVLLAFLYDFLRLSRKIAHPSTFGVNLGDICFFLLAGLLLFLTAYDKNDGQLRGQGFFGAILGFFLYRIIWKDRLVKLLLFCYESLIKFLFWLLRVVLFPVRLVYKMLAKPFYVVAWYSKKQAHRVQGIYLAKKGRKKMRQRRNLAEKKRRKRKVYREKIAVDKG